MLLRSQLWRHHMWVDISGLRDYTKPKSGAVNVRAFSQEPSSTAAKGEDSLHATVPHFGLVRLKLFFPWALYSPSLW